MEIVYLLIPIVLVLVAIMIAVFLWAVRSDQFEDLEGPAHRIIMDDNDKVQPARNDDSRTDNPGADNPSGDNSRTDKAE